MKRKEVVHILSYYLVPHLTKPFVSPIFVALYMFSIGKAEPRPYSKTLERAGMS